MSALSFEDAAQRAVAAASRTLEERKVIEAMIIRFLGEVEGIGRLGFRGNTTLKICHPEGRIRKVFLNDREI